VRRFVQLDGASTCDQAGFTGMGSQRTEPAEGESFGSRLRALRVAASLSQEELAERAHLTTHAVSALERGTRTRPYPHTVRSLADALGASEADREELFAAVPRRRPAPVARRAVTDAAALPGLPTPTTALVARDQEVHKVSALVRDPTQRLVTLTGTGGVGKTRLCIAVASGVQGTFPDGVAFVALAPISDPAGVLAAIADRVGAGTAEGGYAGASLVEHLHGRRLLLVLDNFEHLLDAATEVSTLVESCPGLTVLVTSRAALRVRGETEVPVAPLGVPVGTHPGVEAVTSSPAGALFLERARAVAPDFQLSRPEAAAVARICRRLAGIPLALELAAARTRFLDPATLLARLDDAIAPDGARDLPARQRTMRATLDWSYRLLDPGEQALLRLLSVFSGGFTLDDAEAVAVLAGTVPRAEVLTRLGSLVEHSLVVTGSHVGRLRYDLLEPVAQYGRSMLVEAGDSRVVGHAHTRHFLALAEQAEPEYQRSEQVAWLARIDTEHANLTAALERAIADGDAETAGRMGWSLWLYWWLRGHLLHGRRLLEGALELPLPERIRIRTLLAAASTVFALSDFDASRRWWQCALDLARKADEPLLLAYSLAGVGLSALVTDDLAEAGRLFRESLPVAESTGPEGEWLAGLTQIWLGTVALLGGDPDAAVSHMERGLASARRRGDRLSSYIALYNLSQVASAGGDTALARRHLNEGMQLSMQTRDLANLAYLLDALAVVEAADGTYARVPVLFGAAQGIRDSIGSVGYGYYRPDEQQKGQAAAEARGRLGDDRYDDDLDAGRSLGPTDAAAFALDPGLLQV
jgi:predicted ATPase/transcriptional regulator with XRE-family HTH domain